MEFSFTFSNKIFRPLFELNILKSYDPTVDALFDKTLNEFH